MIDDFTESNRELWNKLTPVNAASRFYDLDGFLNGDCSLQPIELEEVGSVAGKSLLHLQCHFGMDTLSWGRLGARVTGVDFSEEAISLAYSLADKLSMNTEFICSDIYDLRSRLSGEFDIVFTSAGVLCWLQDIPRWAEIAASFVKPGGFLYVREFHPFAYMFDDTNNSPVPVLRHPYFPAEQPLRFEDQGSYANPESDIRTVSYEWSHSLAEITCALIDAGLTIEFLHEFPFSTYPSHPFLEKAEDGSWQYDKIDGGLPLMFSIRARKRLRSR
jgi:SAM-dependent methyltransferase